MWQSIQRNVTWRAIPIAGLLAGSLFLIVNFVLSPILLKVNGSLALRYFASLLLGEDVLLDDSMMVLVTGVIVHYALSIIFTLIIAIVVHRWGFFIGLIGGALLGLAIYAINLYTMTVFFEWFFAINSEVLVWSHVAFGAIAGGIYELFDHYDVDITKEVLNETA